MKNKDFVSFLVMVKQVLTVYFLFLDKKNFNLVFDTLPHPSLTLAPTKKFFTHVEIFLYSLNKKMELGCILIVCAFIHC